MCCVLCSLGSFWYKQEVFKATHFSPLDSLPANLQLDSTCPTCIISFEGLLVALMLQALQKQM